jgi:hypothetical protein
MTIKETREIKERISLETVNLEREELYEYYTKKLAIAQEILEGLRETA